MRTPHANTSTITGSMNARDLVRRVRSLGNPVNSSPTDAARTPPRGAHDETRDVESGRTRGGGAPPPREAHARR